MKTILITGGAGYIGSHCVQDLLAHSYRCIVVDNLSTGFREAVTSPDFIQLDLRDKDALTAVFEKYSIDGVVHFAASTEVGESVVNPIKFFDNNVTATFNLLAIMAQFNVATLVFSSTCAVYGNPQYVPLDEKHPQNPINPYGKSKHIIESVLEDYAHAYGLKYMILRYFNVAGCDTKNKLGDRRQPATLLIPLALEAVLGKRKAITVFGKDYDTPDGTCIRDYIHVEDVSIAHRLALEKMFSGASSACINLGVGIGASVLEVLSTAERVTGKSVPMNIGERRPGDSPMLIASPAKPL